MEMEIKMNKEITTWKWFKTYVTKLDYLDSLLLQEPEWEVNKRETYFNNLRYISEVYYNVNYNLEIVLLNKEEIKKKSLNKRIGIIYENIQNLIKIIDQFNEKYNPVLKQEKRAYNIIMDQFKRVKLTIQKYFKEEFKNQEESKNQVEDKQNQKEEKVKIKRDKLNPNHIRFIYE
jgi:tRNA G10  N-methylase Trm11